MSEQDNGKLKPEEKTLEQLKEERAKRFADNPDTFLEISEIVCAAVKNPKSQLGVSVYIGLCRRIELDIGQVELNHLIQKNRMSMDIAADMKKVGSQVLAPGKQPFYKGVFGKRR